MKRQVEIPKGSLAHFLYTAAMVFVAAMSIGVMRRYPTEPLIFWGGMAILWIDYLAWKWLCEHHGGNCLNEEDDRHLPMT